MEFQSDAVKLRMQILTMIAKAVLGDRLTDQVDRIPLQLRPTHDKSTTCCIYHDRAIIKYRCMAAMGFRFEDETDELTPLAAYAQLATQRREVTGPIMTVNDLACRGCVRAHYEVTSACRSCLARPCIHHCPKQAIDFVDGRSHIDPDKCINCGLCMKVCPYHAIIRIPVPCQEACPVDAIYRDPESGRQKIDYDRCFFCGQCMVACPFAAVARRFEIVDVLTRLKTDRPVIAMCAPAIAGQFQTDPEHLAGALKQLGFDHCIEVAFGADHVAKAEADEFVQRINSGADFMTSSCCPAFYQAVKRHVPEIADRLSSTPSPMHVTGQWVKEHYPEAITVFIGPCAAKRAEALNDPHVDYVLDFEECYAMFQAAEIQPDQCQPMPTLQPGCREGRGFAVTGGVTRAINAYVGDRVVLKPVSINGLNRANLKLLKSFANGKCPGNFVEIMGCEGGCVAGPGIVAEPAKAAKAVMQFAENAESGT